MLTTGRNVSGGVIAAHVDSARVPSARERCRSDARERTAATRILFIKGASFNREVPQFSYPLGIMYMASFLRSEQPEHELRILDLRCEKNPTDSLCRTLREFVPHIVAVSALTCEAESLHHAASEAKSACRKLSDQFG